MNLTRSLPLSGLLWMMFLPVCTGIGIFSLWGTFPQIASPEIPALLNGQTRHDFEKKFDESAPHREPSVIAWGQAEYALFHQGRPGVVLGREGWLFTAEEFTVHRDDNKNYINNINYIKSVFKNLNEQKISLIIAPIPAKTRLYADYLPAGVTWPVHRQGLYPRLIQDLSDSHIPAADLLADFQSARREGPPLFLKTDTHWTPAGAQRASARIADQVHTLKIDLGLPQDFTRTLDPARPHAGDLRKYVPLGTQAEKIFPADELATPRVTRTESPASAGSLFGDSALPATLVGTSYSANPDWGFLANLKYALKTDILNAADEGQGPFTTMAAYLNSDTFKNAPPRLIVWEIPERFLTFAYTLTPP